MTRPTGLDYVFAVPGPREASHFIMRATRWLQHGERHPTFEVLLHAAIDARYGIEELLFELLLVGRRGSLTEEEYKTCLKGSELHKVIRRLVPEFKKLQAFTLIVVGLLPPPTPAVVEWDIGELLRNWGELSEYLHWRGAPSRTTDDTAWVAEGLRRVNKTVSKLAMKMRSGGLGTIDPSTMPPDTAEIWRAFKNDEIDEAKARELLLRQIGL